MKNVKHTLTHTRARALAEREREKETKSKRQKEERKGGTSLVGIKKSKIEKKPFLNIL